MFVLPTFLLFRRLLLLLSGGDRRDTPIARLRRPRELLSLLSLALVLLRLLWILRMRLEGRRQR